MLEAIHVSKIYKRGEQEIKAIHNLSFKIDQGDFVSIMGPSGSGKSTLLLMLGGMLSPTDGQIMIANSSFYALNPTERTQLRRQKIGFLFQTFNLIPYLTALQNVQLPLLVSQLEERQQEERAKELLERVDLGDRIDHLPSELSIGQQQRLALARMLANDPTIILADEPTGNLDADRSQQVINFLIELNREGRTIIIVTHDLRVANQAQRTIIITNGGILNPSCDK